MAAEQLAERIGIAGYVKTQQLGVWPAAGGGGPEVQPVPRTVTL
jgi:hypothetical protein